jgi:hypothetical protein
LLISVIACSWPGKGIEGKEDLAGFLTSRLKLIELLLNNRAKVFGHGFSRMNTDYTNIKEKSVSEAAKSV